MGCLRYPRKKQTSASAAAMTDPDPNPFADCDVVVCYGNAKSEDTQVKIPQVKAGRTERRPGGLRLTQNGAR